MTRDDELMDEIDAELGPIEVEMLGRPLDPGPGVAEEWNDDPTSRDYRMANRPPDAVLDPIDATMLELENKARAEMDRRDAREVILKAEIDQIEDVRAILIGELLAREQTIRRLTALAVILFCALCWLEGWRVAAWVWHHVWPWIMVAWRWV